MKLKLQIAVSIAGALSWSTLGIASEFVNLDFDEGDTSIGIIDPPGLDGVSLGSLHFWMPGWRLFAGDIEGTSVFFGLQPGDIGAQSLYNATSTPQGLPADGKFAFLATSQKFIEYTASILQVGDIPADAKSLHYNAAGGPWDVRINGIQLPLNGWDPENTSLTFQDVAMDVSPWAGQQVELKLTQTFGYSFNAIDSIRFSPDPVIPEPGNGTLVLVGGGILWLVDKVRKCRPKVNCS